MQTVYLGTYTKAESKGVYTVDFDNTTGQLSNLTLLIETKNPTYLDSDAETNTLYSVADESGDGGINVWNLNVLPPTKLETLVQPGTPPCFVHYDSVTKTVYDANYHLGTVHAYVEGILEKTFQYNTGSRAHFVQTHPQTEDVYVCDLGLDVIHKYRLLNEIATYHTPDKTGPRHIAFHPIKPVLYVFGELSSEIIVLEDTEFEFKHLQTLSTLPVGEDSIKSGAAIRISSDGRFVYASNRGHDSLSVFTVNDDATLSLIQNISSGGQHPRDFALTPDETHIIVANRDTNNLAVLKRDPQTGTLTTLNNDFHAPEAVCVHFMK